MLRAIKDICVAPSSLTTASLIDTVNDAKRTVVNGPVPFIFNSLQVISSELGVFLPAYDPAFMNTLTKLYDGEFYEERRRTGKVNHIRIESPQLSILGGTTPSYLNSFLPDGAWDQGFTSRTIMIYHGASSRRSIFSDGTDVGNEAMYRDLIADLARLKTLSGGFNWDPGAVEGITNWYHNGEKPVPVHAKLKHYNTRRVAHLIKLSMIAAVARRSDMTVLLEDFVQAAEWLFEAEDLLPEIFSVAGVNVESRAMDDLIYMIEKSFAKNQRPVSEYFLVNFLKDRVPSYAVMKVIEIMVKSHKVKVQLIAGVPGYTPAP
jgi:hypothetical protein